MHLRGTIKACQSALYAVNRGGEGGAKRDDPPAEVERCGARRAVVLNTNKYILVSMTSASTQINLRLPPKLQSAAEQYTENFGYRNIQELILEAIRDKIFRDNKYDETFSAKEIDLIEKLLSVSIEKGKIKDKNDIIKALQ